MNIVITWFQNFIQYVGRSEENTSDVRGDTRFTKTMLVRTIAMFFSTNAKKYSLLMILD